LLDADPDVRPNLREAERTAMACYYRQHADTTVTVPKFSNESSSGGVTYYDIKVRVGKVEWLVERRYRDFANLHEKLVGEISISKKLLPPKKVRPQTFITHTYVSYE